MIRIGKRGYLEMPSRLAETCRGWEHPHIAGLSHHRWLIEIQGTRVTFLMKFHRMHAHWRLSLPPRVLGALPETAKVQWLFWDGSFEYEERTIHSLDAIDRELERFVQSTAPYATWRLDVDATARQGVGAVSRAWRFAKRRLNRV
jgi:hypothetical protein